MTRGIDRTRHDPASPKANPHWARLYAAKRREIDIALLKEAERTIEPMIVAVEEPIDDMRANLARAFGRPP